MSHVRPTAVAGAFYPDDPQTIKAVFSQWMPRNEKLAKPSIKPVPRVLIVPHAGYVYSGEAAAKGYRLWQDSSSQIKTVVVMGPAHRVSFVGVATISADEVATPLGNLQVDVQLRDKLIEACSQVGVSDMANAPEHSLEVHFPFIKNLLPGVKVLPLLNGQVTASEVLDVIQHLWNEEGVYFVISSDLSHFRPYEEAQKLDGETAKAIRQGNWQALNGEMACGYKGIQGVLGVMRDHPMMIEQIALINSGDTAGTKDRVVGYGTWAMYELQ
ncbi:AmmeMemoRadiSam system protein B [Hydrogenovibrio sp. JE_KL2]|uniref:AmmeMemoRadiSam system protein B n=1 Tax=Hydrogenovibrio sp. JE_KL2 TaxID=2651188 RepID=UPI00128C66DF|nr:AmmeMemoRadiSam system protein B [Hydrogenovibrio sp. JE_KL2]MPQ77137.1 AmmeMemoRadiSam system protein B [Hydrogenovibrio sp. JE_KL2]